MRLLTKLGSGSRLGRGLQGEAGRGLAVAAVNDRADADLAGVNGTGDAVAGLDIQLGGGIL
jgi:hypothetical protein